MAGNVSPNLHSSADTHTAMRIKKKMLAKNIHTKKLLLYFSFSDGTLFYSSAVYDSIT